MDIFAVVFVVMMSGDVNCLTRVCVCVCVCVCVLT